MMEVWIVVTEYDEVGVVDLELLDSPPRWAKEIGQSLWIGNVNGGDSLPLPWPMDLVGEYLEARRHTPDVKADDYVAGSLDDLSDRHPEIPARMLDMVGDLLLQAL